MGRLHETQIDQLDVRERSHELHANLHLSLEGDILEENGHSSRQTLAETNLEHNLRVDLLGCLIRCNIRDVVGRKGNAPLHEDDILGGIGIRADFVDVWGFGAKGESGKTDGVEEGRRGHGENLLDRVDNRATEDRFIDEPEALKESVHPVGRLALGCEAVLGEFALNVVPGPTTDTTN